jgi:HEPN domain-containing protein
MSEKIDIVKQWIEKADHDLGTAQVTYLYLPKYRDTIAFHCQQAAEKYLKGFLLFLDISFNGHAREKITLRRELLNLWCRI